MSADANAGPAVFGRAGPQPQSDWMRRIAVTIFALMVYRLALLIPAPGINPDAVSGSSAISPGYSVVSYVSILTIGLTPAFSVYALFEFAKLAFEDLRDWGADSAEGARKRERGLAIVILILAAFQAYGVAVGLLSLDETSPWRMLIVSPREYFVTGFVATNVAGTALLLWLASIISRHGIGSGFWVLFLLPSLMAFVALPAEVLERTRIGEISTGLPFVIAAILAVIAAATVTLARRWLATAVDSNLAGEHTPSEAIGALVWPGFLATAVSGLLSSALTLFDSSSQPTAIAGSPAILALSTVLIFFVTYRYIHVHLARTPAVRQTLKGLMLATAVTLALSYVAIEVLVWQLGAPASLSSLPWIAILAILTPILPRDVRLYVPSSAPAPPVTDADFGQR